MNIVGRLTRDAIVKTLEDNREVVNFSVAINDSYRNKQGENVQQTTYFDCSYWLSTNVTKILRKGALVELTGRVSARAWINKEGQPQAGLNFHTSKIKLHAGGKSEGSTQVAYTTQVTATDTPTTETKEDELPF